MLKVVLKNISRLSTGRRENANHCWTQSPVVQFISHFADYSHGAGGLAR